MARRGVMTALQAALAGIGGAAGGYVQQEELKRKRKAEEEARTRQEMLDVVGLQERGFMSPEQLARQQEQGKRTTGSVVQNALLSALSPRAGVLPPPTAQDVGTASQALATAGRAPQRIVTAGGQEMFRTETPQQEELRLERLKEERTRMGRFEEDRAAIDRAVRIAREQGKVQRESAEEAFQVTNQRDFQLAQRLGLTKKGEKYDPKTTYGDVIEIETRKRGGTTGPNMVSIRMSAVENLTKELGRKPTDTEVDEYVSLVIPQAVAAPAGGSRLSQGIAFARRLRDQGVSRDEAAKQVRAQFPDVADQLLGAPAAPAQAPLTMPAQAGGLFGRDMLASPVGAAQPGNMDEIRSLAARLAELNKGKRGGMAAREQYQRNAAERARVQAALAEAQRRYSASR